MSTARIWISAHQYYVQSRLNLDGWDGTATNGPVAALDHQGRPAVPGCQAVVLTGTDTGWVEVELRVSLDPPGLPELTAWDDVVEVSLDLGPTGGRVVTDAKDESRALPALPSGSFRLRVHATGRDAASLNDGDDTDPVERHMLQAWPSPAAPEEVHQLRDRVGHANRQDAL